MREKLHAEVGPGAVCLVACLAEWPLMLWGWLAERKSSALTPEAVNYSDVLPHTEAFMAVLRKVPYGWLERLARLRAEGGEER